VVHSERGNQWEVECHLEPPLTETQPPLGLLLQMFGQYMVARSYECDEDAHPKLVAKVVELAAGPAHGSAELISTEDPARYDPLGFDEETLPRRREPFP
jgi:hypothetical protein